MRESKPLVIGLGNEFRGDDAIGVIIVRKLEKEYPDKGEYVIEQSDLTRILEKWKDRKVVIIDAVFTDSPEAGKIHESKSLEGLSFINKKQYSSHGVGLHEIYKLGESLNKLPRSVHVIGIEGINWEIGRMMSSKLIAEIPKVISLALQSIK